MFCVTMKVLLRIAAHLIVAVLLTVPLAAQPLSRSVLLLNQSDAGFRFRRNSTIEFHKYSAIRFSYSR